MDVSHWEGVESSLDRTVQCAWKEGRKSSCVPVVGYMREGAVVWMELCSWRREKKRRRRRDRLTDTRTRKRRKGKNSAFSSQILESSYATC